MRSRFRPFNLVFVLSLSASFLHGPHFVEPCAAQMTTQAQGVFLAFHLEVSSPSRVTILWPKLVSFMNLADSYGAKVSLQFSVPWAQYVYDQNLTAQVNAWESNGHEIALHHHGPTHKFFDGYTDRSDLLQPPDWYGTDGIQVGNMADLMNFLEPLSDLPILSAGMSDAEWDWPDGVLYYATKAGTDNSKTDLISVPTVATYNGHTVIKVTNAGYAISHLGSAAVTLTDIAQGLQNATPDQIIGIVISDDTIENFYVQIEPLFMLLEQFGVQAQTTRYVLEHYSPSLAAGIESAVDNWQRYR